MGRTRVNAEVIGAYARVPIYVSEEKVMKSFHLMLGTAVAVAGLAIASTADAAPSGIRVGDLTCNVASGWGFGVGASTGSCASRTALFNISRARRSLAPHPGHAGHGPSNGGVTQPCFAIGVGQSLHRTWICDALSVARFLLCWPPANRESARRVDQRPNRRFRSGIDPTRRDPAGRR